jgi:hypothetical protein
VGTVGSSLGRGIVLFGIGVERGFTVWKGFSPLWERFDSVKEFLLLLIKAF